MAVGHRQCGHGQTVGNLGLVVRMQIIGIADVDGRLHRGARIGEASSLGVAQLGPFGSHWDARADTRQLHEEEGED